MDMIGEALYIVGAGANRPPHFIIIQIHASPLVAALLADLLNTIFRILAV
jgi:hypothetical protein